MKLKKMQKEGGKNVAVDVGSMFISHRNIVSNIIKCILIMEKIEKKALVQIPKYRVFNLINILPKIEIISHCY